MRSVLLLLSLFTVTPLVAQDWPQWLGPQRDGTINASIKPWQGALPVAWETKVGDGHSSPIVADGKVFLHDKAPGSDEEVITAWDLDGKQLWQERNTRAAFTSQFGVGPRATPAYSAGKLYTLGVTGILICRDAKTGKEIWKNNLLESFSAKNLYFGVSSSPLVDDKNVYVMPGGTTGSIVALNKDTGSVFWKSGTDKASYSSPMMTSVDSKPILVFQTQAGVVGLKPERAKRGPHLLLWYTGSVCGSSLCRHGADHQSDSHAAVHRSQNREEPVDQEGCWEVSRDSAQDQGTSADAGRRWRPGAAGTEHHCVQGTGSLHGLQDDLGPPRLCQWAVHRS
jgi:hypothetical protein